MRTGHFKDYRADTIDYGGIGEPEWIYLAGLFDGEGYLGTHTPKTQITGSIRLEVASTYLPVLDEYARKLGGTIRLVPMSSSSRRRSFALRLHRACRVKSVLEHIFPHLRIKRWQAAIGIMFLRRSGLGCRSQYDINLLRWLKQANGYRSF